MGGCCCCSSRSAQLDGPPEYYYCSEGLEERQPLSPAIAAPAALSTGFLVDTNLDTSTPDTYQSPPPPVPYDADIGRPHTPTNNNKIDAAARTSDSASVRETESGIEEGSLKELLDCKNEANSLPPSPKKSDEPSKLSELMASQTVEEDVCPTCLEEYDEENPRIVTKCEHHFHLSCILEWMERSDTCPVCDQEMIFNHTVNV